MTRTEAILWLNEEIRTWENECQSKHPIKEALYAARRALEQESTTKNDLGVDAISRQAVIDELKRYFHDEYYQRTSIQDCRDCFIEDVLNHLPSVTSQEPRWIPITERLPNNSGRYWLVMNRAMYLRRIIMNRFQSGVLQPLKESLHGCHYPNHIRRIRNDKRRS